MVRTNRSPKAEAKLIACRVLGEMVGDRRGAMVPKYFYAAHLIAMISAYATNPKMKRLTYNQCRRALKKLGFTGSAV